MPAAPSSGEPTPSERCTTPDVSTDYRTLITVRAKALPPRALAPTLADSRFALPILCPCAARCAASTAPARTREPDEHISTRPRPGALPGLATTTTSAPLGHPHPHTGTRVQQAAILVAAHTRAAGGAAERHPRLRLRRRLRERHADPAYHDAHLQQRQSRQHWQGVSWRLLPAAAPRLSAPSPPEQACTMCETFMRESWVGQQRPCIIGV